MLRRLRSSDDASGSGKDRAGAEGGGDGDDGAGGDEGGYDGGAVVCAGAARDGAGTGDGSTGNDDGSDAGDGDDADAFFATCERVLLHGSEQDIHLLGTTNTGSISSNNSNSRNDNNGNTDTDVLSPTLNDGGNDNNDINDINDNNEDTRADGVDAHNSDLAPGTRPASMRRRMQYLTRRLVSYMETTGVQVRMYVYGYPRVNGVRMHKCVEQRIFIDRYM